MNFESLKLGFKEYLRKYADLSEEKYELDSEDVSIFTYTDEFKNYLQDELNYDIDDFNKSLSAILKYEIVDGKLVNPNEEDTSDDSGENTEVSVDSEENTEVSPNSLAASENASDAAEETTVQDDTGEVLSDEIIVEIINDLLQDETFSEIMDRDSDGEITTEELQSFFETIKSNDGNEKDISLEDVLSATEEIKEGEFEFSNESEVDDDTKTTAAKSTGSSSGTSSGGTSSISDSASSDEELTLDNMTEEQLNEVYNETQSAISENQDLLKSIIDNSNSELSAALAEIDEAYQNYLEQLELVDEDMAEKLNDKVSEITDKEQEIMECELEIVDQQQAVQDAQNTYDSAVSTKENLASILASLESVDTSDLESEELAELKSQISEVETKYNQAVEDEAAALESLNAANEALDELNEQLSGEEGLEAQLADLQEQKAEIEEEISSAYPEIQEYMDTYNNLKDTYESDKKDAIDTLNSTISEQQSYMAEIEQAKTNLQNKNDVKEYAFGSFGEEIAEYALSFVGYNEADGSADIFLGGSSSSATPWCAAFVEYVLENSGNYEDIPDWYKNISNKWLCQNVLDEASAADAIVSGDEVEVGDLLVYTNGNHIGIVTSIEGNTIHTVEGNSSNKVNSSKTYDINDSSIAFCDIT